ncbi:MAG: CoA-binding protein [Flavobacteriaceae bacterium]|nr:MAG: CoA-binding protein [Flavobacteriaceae bacterium]
MKKTLVFGASLNQNRYSNLAINKLRGKKIETTAFGLREGTVADVEIKTDLEKFRNIHTITLYLNAKRQKAYYEQIIELKPQRVIFNPGTENPEFYTLLRNSKIKVEEACTLVLLATNQY